MRRFALMTMMLLCLALNSPAKSADAPKSGTIEDLVWSDARVAVALLWGDDAAGPYGKLVKFPPGLVSPPHFHSEDYTAVVISGILLDPTDPTDAARPLAAGGFYLLPGGTVYTVRCVSEVPCLVYAHQAGGFDFNRTD